MYPDWSETTQLDERINNSKRYSEQSGIYILSTTSKPIQRAMGEDTSGILYIGKSKNLKSRISGLRSSNHNATWFLFNNRALARFYIDKNINDSEAMKPFVGKLNITLANSNEMYSESVLESIALFSYVMRFGEMPPLNSALPKRWEHESNELDMKWFLNKFT
jgi:hypothetical protein